MENKILLSICIPTYNRSDYVIKTLRNFDNQLKSLNLTRVFEIIISDNNSTDDSKKKIIDYIGNKPYIKYYRNNENVGFGRNIERLSIIAKGEYLWFCGDDDLYASDIVESIYSILSKNIDYLYISYTEKEAEIDNKKNDTLFVNNKADLFKYIKNGPGFLSSSIFKADLYNSIKVDCGNWIHFVKLINFPTNFNSIVLKNKKICIYRPANNNWFQKKTMCFYIIEIMTSISQSCLLSEETKQQLLHQYTFNFCFSYLKPFIYSISCKKRDLEDIRIKINKLNELNNATFTNEKKYVDMNYLIIVFLRPFYLLENILYRLIRKIKDGIN